MNYDKYINPTTLEMYVVAVRTGRFPIESVSEIYREKVNEILDFEKGLK